MNDGATMEDRLISGVAAGELQVFSPELFSYISGDLISAVRPAFRRNTANADTSYAYGLRDDAFVTALEMNLFHFSAGKTLAEIQALNGAFRESSSYTDFEKRAQGDLRHVQPHMAAHGVRDRRAGGGIRIELPPPDGEEEAVPVLEIRHRRR